MPPRSRPRRVRLARLDPFLAAWSADVPVVAFVNNHFAGYAPETVRQLVEQTDPATPAGRGPSSLCPARRAAAAEVRQSLRPPSGLHPPGAGRRLTREWMCAAVKATGDQARRWDSADVAGLSASLPR